MTALSIPARRGWCPGILRPVRTGDGLLVRVHPSAGVLTAKQARAIANAARTCGNGLVDVSSRANLQIRGVSETTHPALVRLLDAAGLLGAEGGDGPYRPCIVSPLAGIDGAECFDARALALAIETRLGADSTLSILPQKLAIVVDSGGSFSLSDVDGDIRVGAGQQRGSALVGIPLGDAVAWIAEKEVKEVPALVHSVAAALAFVLRQDASGRRMRQVAERVLERLGIAASLVAPQTQRSQAARVGAVATAQGTAVLVGMPFGRCNADHLDTLADWSDRFGTGEIRTASWRAIAVPGLSQQHASELLAWSAANGLIVDVDDPRLSIAACPGAPACASAQGGTHDDAMKIAAALAQVKNIAVHVSGCAKGCARRTSADLTLVGGVNGYGIVLGGTAADSPRAQLGLPEILERLRGTSSRADLVRLFPEGRP